MLTENKTVDNKKINKIKKDIKKFIGLIDKQEIPDISAGDCWHCLMKDEQGKNLGDLTNSEHLQEHIKEGYLTGSLLYNAILESGYRAEQFYILKTMNLKDSFKRSLRKYLYKRLLNTENLF